MRSNQKFYLAGIALSLLLSAPSLALSKNTAALKAEITPQKKISKSEPIKVAAVGTTGFGFSEAATDLKMTVALAGRSQYLAPKKSSVWQIKMD